jgi:hypothetical protein
MTKGKVFPVFQPHFFSPRWQILNEEIDCTEEEMMLFAALQLQVSKSINAVRKLETYQSPCFQVKLSFVFPGGNAGQCATAGSRRRRR